MYQNWLTLTHQYHTHIWTPASLPCHPADLGLAVGALEPVAAPLAHQQHLAVRAVHRVALLHHALEDILGEWG